MTEKCAPTINATPMAREHARRRVVVLAAALVLGACSATPSDADANMTQPARVERAAAPAAPSTTSSPTGKTGELKLSGAADAVATVAVLTEAKRQGLTEVEIASTQSFRIMEGGREIGTLVTGEGNMPGAANAGCFVAVVQNGDAALIPTIGYADYEAETCSGPASVGLLSSGNPVRFGTVFRASSPNAQVSEPIIITWDRSINTLLIDDALSAKASQSGALTIAKMRALQ